MIILKKINGLEIIVNADEIETVESGHDTVISLKSGKKIIVSESAKEIISKVIQYRRMCFDSTMPIIQEK